MEPPRSALPPLSSHGPVGLSEGALARAKAEELPRGSSTLLREMEDDVRGRHVVYLSTPITTGLRYLNWRRSNQHRSPGADLPDTDIRAEVVAENVRAVAPLRRRILDEYPESRLVDPTELAAEGWRQRDYHRFWLEVIERYADVVVFASGWQYSTGCTLEFMAALEANRKLRDADLQVLDLGTAADELERAVGSLTEVGLPTAIAESALDLVRLQLNASVRAAGVREMKDRGLANLAETHNVALFASFDTRLSVRSAILRGNAEASPQRFSAAELVTRILDQSRDHSVNIRTFRENPSEGSPFIYGLRNVTDVLGELERQAMAGYFTIVNETIDVHDGGVSGVTMGGVAEFSPDATPRAVEGSGTLRLPVDIANVVLSSVYNCAITLPEAPGRRIEFSVHPNRVGHRHGHVTVWEIGDSTPLPRVARTTWPNNFSRMLGDKAFGLLLAHVSGVMVPRSYVIGRRVAPFSFGARTGTGEWWTRTAPAEPEPGHFTTASKWIDPYALIHGEDPSGRFLASVISQEAVSSRFSGATLPIGDSESLVEGVSGQGSAFMLGQLPPAELPVEVVSQVNEAVASLSEMWGRVSIEWAFDGSQVWVLQLHQSPSYEPEIISPGSPTHWVDYESDSGLAVLRHLIADASAEGAGIAVRGRFGVTSHAGDLLRKANVPARFA